MYQTLNVHQTRLVLMISVEIHAPVHRTQFVGLKIINRFAHANKDMMVNQKFNVLTLVVDQMMNVQQHIHVLIDNVFLLAPLMVAHVENDLNVMASIIMQFANVDLALLVIQRLDATSLVVQVTTNAQQIKLALTPNVKIHAIKYKSVNVTKFVELIIIGHSVAAHRELFQKPMEHANFMNHYVEMIPNVHHSMLVSIANALTHAM